METKADTTGDASTRRLPRIVAPLVLAAVIAWVQSGPFAGGASLTAHHDNLDGAAPLRVEAARQWTAGQLPLWNPYKRAGMPLLADTTSGAAYPGNLPFLLADPAAPDGAAFRVLDAVAALHALLAGVFLYLFLRSIGLGEAAGVFGALAWSSCGATSWFAAWYIQIQNSIAWFPLVLAALQRSSDLGLSSRRGRAWLATGSVAVAMQWLAGFPETSFYGGLVAIAYAASLAGRGRGARPLVAVAAIYAAGIALSAVQLVPALELEAASRRPGAVTLAMFQSLPASLAMWKWWFLPVPAPAVEFPPLAAYHFGAATVVAAAAGLLARSRVGLFFAALFVVGLLMSVGPETPVSAWAWHVPVLSAFRHPFKHLFELSLAMSVLAAIGLDLALRRAPRPLAWPLAAVAVAATAASLHANLATLAQANPASVDVSGRRPALAASIEPGWRTITVRQMLQKQDPGLLLGDYPTRFRVPAVNGAGPYLWKPLADATGLVEEETTFRRGLFGPVDRTLALLSCRYLLQSPRGAGFFPPADEPAWHVVADSPGARLVERGDALARYRFVREARCGDEAAVRASLETGSPDPGEVALVDCAGAPPPPAALASPSTAGVEPVDGRAGFVALKTSVPPGPPAFLVVSQADLPGWKAFADDRPVPVVRVQGLVQGVEVPAGTSRVELRYAPASVAAGAAASAAAALVLLLFVLRGSRSGNDA